MSKLIQPEGGDLSPLSRLSQKAGRRDFLKWSGAGAAALFVAGCDEATRTVAVVQPPDTIIRTDTVAPPPPPVATIALDFTSPFGVVNYAYLLEQLEAAFYMRVTSDLYAGATDAEANVLIDIRDHEIAHREFFEAGITALGGTPIPMATFDFSAVNFDDRTSVLQTARTFEDLGVWAYNGAASLIEDRNLLLQAGKIVSVEARHAAAIRDLLDPLSFAPDAFDMALPPSEVLEAAGPFIVNTVTPTGLSA